ncbi:CocE/NonD family hydrolase [Streptomyces shenzhenensis]|uniref:Peptidase S15 n=1 Tax=Streptomyces shenzhenensis TaxID=943815 RepID=A0A3M0HZZ0_9ACTN|nr:CocE/NonD family hydrolase [Streptomyces shenzhenensis]RMB82255.1 peptidase S15 [Streptomyces shenzhenensis]
MHIRTSFPHETAHTDLWIPLADGTRLYARVWRPLTDGPVPALLEYAPDRLTDRTAPRDAQRHPWYAGHGYASVRVDARGYGTSEGVPTGAGATAEAAEAADGVEVVEWLAAQPWCDGNVGVFGISRGGSASLRIAALAPEPLKAVVAVCCADGQNENEGHDPGGSAFAAQLHARSAAALTTAALPPDPRYAGDAWQALWPTRLEALAPALHTWLAPRSTGAQGDDSKAPYGHAGPPPGPGAVKAAVLAVGGWYGPHHDTVLRLVERLPRDRVRGLIGPWSHHYPDQDLSPGPAIGFLQETLRWWDHWLKGGSPTGTSHDPPSDALHGSVSGTSHGSVGTRPVMSEPLLRAYVTGSRPPAPAGAGSPGRWVGEPAWPSPDVTSVVYELRGDPVLVRSPLHTGVDAGRFRPAGDDADLPLDQRAEDGRSLCFDFEVAEETWVLGRPRAQLRLIRPAPRTQLIARVCDIAPDGASALVARGVLELAAPPGREGPAPRTPGGTADVTVELGGVGHVFPAGHRIRLAVSSAYWPSVWPRPESAAGCTLDPVGSSLELPVRARTSDSAIVFGAPEQAEPLGASESVTLDGPRPRLLVVRDIAEDEWRVEVAPCAAGTRAYPDGLEWTEDALETYTITGNDPLSARARSDRSVRLHRPDLAWDTTVRVRSEISCDVGHFVTVDEVVCTAGSEVVFHRTWEKRIPRTTE